MRKITDNAVTFLSLGPGDPDLLTMEAVSVLQTADVVMLPATKTDGEGRVKSRAAAIVSERCATEKMQFFELPMQKDRQAVMTVYDRVYREAADRYRAGQRVVVAVEGDAGIYASIHYVLERLQAEGVAVRQLPGIPSFIAAASRAGLSLVSQRQRMIVLPGDADVETLSWLLTHNHVVAIMKLSGCQQAVKEFLRATPSATCHYFENVGSADEFYTTAHEVILDREMPYFSLCILYPL